MMSTESILTCPGCGLDGFSSGKDGIPLRNYYIHCLFKCYKYLELNLAKSCLNCNVLLLNQQELDDHEVICSGKDDNEELVDERATKEVKPEDVESRNEFKENEDKDFNHKFKYQCKHCLIRFKHKRDRKCHIKSIHKDLKCHICGIEFETSTGLKHQTYFRKHVHINDDMFKVVPVVDTKLMSNWKAYLKGNRCKLCKSTLSESYRVEHFERHFGHCYQCQWCPELVTTRHCLTRHNTRHHPGK